MIEIDSSSLGKKIFEQEYVGKYNPETKLFENRNGGLRNIYKERNLSALKYMHDVAISPAELKIYEWNYLYSDINEEEVSESIYKDLDGVLYYITSKENWQRIKTTGIISTKELNKIYLFRTLEPKLEKFDQNLIIIKIDSKDWRTYKENDISTHYKFFNYTYSDRVFTY